MLTGETGAGKSIIIDALNLLLGGRADTDSIRTGETSALVEGIFQISNEDTLAIGAVKLGLNQSMANFI